MDAIYQGTVHTAMHRPVQVQTRAGSPAEARKLIKGMFKVTTRVTNVIKLRDLPPAAE